MYYNELEVERKKKAELKINKKGFFFSPVMKLKIESNAFFSRKKQES